MDRQDAEFAIELAERAAHMNTTAAGEAGGVHWRARSIQHRTKATVQFKVCAPGYDPKNDNGYNVISRSALIDLVVRGPFVLKLGRRP